MPRCAILRVLTASLTIAHVMTDPLRPRPCPPLKAPQITSAASRGKEIVAWSLHQEYGSPRRRKEPVHVVPAVQRMPSREQQLPVGGITVPHVHPPDLLGPARRQRQVPPACILRGPERHPVAQLEQAADRASGSNRILANKAYKCVRKMADKGHAKTFASFISWGDLASRCAGSYAGQAAR